MQLESPNCRWNFNKMDPEFPCNWCSKINNEVSTNLGGTIIKWIWNFDIIGVPK